MAPYQRLLFATDLSENTEKVVQKLSQLTNICHAELHLIHVIEPLPTYSYIELGPMDFEPAAQRALKHLGQALQVPEEHQYIEFGAVHPQLMSAIERLQIDLMIVGYHERSATKWLFGSHAASIAKQAGCDVLILHNVCEET